MHKGPKEAILCSMNALSTGANYYSLIKSAYASATSLRHPFPSRFYEANITLTAESRLKVFPGLHERGMRKRENQKCLNVPECERASELRLVSALADRPSAICSSPAGERARERSDADSEPADLAPGGVSRVLQRAPCFGVLRDFFLRANT